MFDAWPWRYPDAPQRATRILSELLCYVCEMPTALITGTSTGIGMETAFYFAEQGYRVFAGARKPEMVERRANIVPVKLDVDKDESVRACVGEVLKEAGTIDVLVNNAGVGLAGAVEMVPLKRVREMFETNFFGAVRMMQAVLPSMRERGSGTVVNVTSIMGHVTLGGHGFYSATKFALAAVSESLAMEMKPFGVRVAIIEPGVILTPIWNKAEAAMPEGHPYGQAMGRLFRMFGAQMEGGTKPDVVARAIHEAVGEGATKLRYAVGADAEAMAAARDRMTASAWAALLTEEDEERFVSGAEKAFGVDLLNPPSLNARRLAGSRTGGQ
jgi:NAD(P)-dependent dehydrogenase (short-subunit alcohol dehydrogenase family)